MRSNNGRIKQKSLILFNAVYIVFILCVINLKQHSFLLVTGYTVDREPNIIESYKRKIYFAGETPVTGTELFVSDGTYSGTSIFADISWISCVSCVRIWSWLLIIIPQEIA